MPEAKTVERARKAQREGRASTTQAGEFVREEIEHVRRGKHGARSPKQAIAIGLSKARRAGVKVRAPKRGQASARTVRQAERDEQKGGTRRRATSRRRARAAVRALRREGSSAASPRALASQPRKASRGRKTTARARSTRASTTSSRGGQRQGSSSRRGGRSARSQAST
jgi:hypothetical protein